MNRFSREEMLLGAEAMEKLKNAHVAVFGIGGVGSYVCEALVRAGVGNLTLIDNDVVSETNINRQLVALESTVGVAKTKVMADRINDINPNANVSAVNMFYLPENAEDFPLDGYTYIVDCIDTVSGKLSLIERAYNSGINIISSMGTGNKLYGEKLKISDIYKTSVCPLARVIRKGCKDRGIKKLKVCYSEEMPIKHSDMSETTNAGRPIPGSVSFVPSVAGLLIAGEVVRDIIGV